MGTIRLAEARDAPGVTAIYAPFVESTSISFATEVPSAEDMWRTMSKVLERYPWLVLDEDGAVAGYAYAGPHRVRGGYQWSVEASVYVSPDHRRKRVAHRLYERLFEILERQGFFNVYAGVTLPNDPSVAFHQAFGFEPVGVYQKIGFKNGAWHDVGWWFKTLREHEENPQPPIWLPDL